jgi:hypothetical protein
MKRKSRSEEANPLRKTIHQQLASYALLASAAGVNVLALNQPADAEIVFTPAHVVIAGNDKFFLDLNHDGVADFVLSNRNFCTTDICGRTLRVTPGQASNKIVGVKGIFVVDYASALKRGSQIGLSRQFLGKLMAASGTEYGTGGQWLDATNRFLGLKFTVAGQVHFGWARFSVQSGNGRITAVLSGYAYETVVGKPILAGQTKGADEAALSGTEGIATPPADSSQQRASLGLLAQGASGLVAWRKQDNVATRV